MMSERQQAVLYLAKDRLDKAKARILRKGGNITYQLYDEGDGKILGSGCKGI